MDEMERRLRAAMIAAAEQAPGGLMDGIRRRHRRHVRRVGVGCVAVAAAIAAAFPAVMHASLESPLPHGRTATGPAATPASSPTSSPTASPATLLLTCGSANWGQLPSNWRAESLQVGPLWFVDGRQFGYVHYAGSGGSGSSVSRRGKLREGVMIIEVADGSTVVMKVAPAARSYFRFAAGFNGASANNLPGGDTGFTFVSCPHGTTGPNGAVTDFYLGFLIEPGRSAPVDVWTSASPRAVRVIFSCPGLGCQG